MTARAPVRVQRKRTKGWRMPDGAVYVGRPTRWGNDWTVKDAASWGVLPAERPFWVVAKFERDLADWLEGAYWQEQIAELRGRDLACWCPLDQPCHADVLLDLANRPRVSTTGESR